MLRFHEELRSRTESKASDIGGKKTNQDVKAGQKKRGFKCTHTDHIFNMNKETPIGKSNFCKGNGNLKETHTSAAYIYIIYISSW